MTTPPGPRLIGPTLGDSPTPPGGTSRDVSGALPPDLLAQVRGRLRLLVALLTVAFAFDPLLYLLNWIGFAVSALTPSAEFVTKGFFQLVNVGAILASASLWRMARNDRVSPSWLLNAGLVYEVIICFVIALSTQLEYYLAFGLLPNMDWVPGVVILFPLVLPGPPRRMLAAAIMAGLMSPLSMVLLDLLGKAKPTADNYLSSTVHSVFAIGFAFMGARVIYGLGREVVRARELGSYHLGELLGRGRDGRGVPGHPPHAGAPGGHQVDPARDVRRRTG